MLLPVAIGHNDPVHLKTKLRTLYTQIVLDIIKYWKRFYWQNVIWKHCWNVRSVSLVFAKKTKAFCLVWTLLHWVSWVTLTQPESSFSEGQSFIIEWDNSCANPKLAFQHQLSWFPPHPINQDFQKLINTSFSDPLFQSCWNNFVFPVSSDSPNFLGLLFFSISPPLCSTFVHLFSFARSCQIKFQHTFLFNIGIWAIAKVDHSHTAWNRQWKFIFSLVEQIIQKIFL